ncbi:MAG: FAD-dependent oxidoreductase [Deltaproteobacteria bacterium]|nr:FAD-dependent oxidoreductase [Deltaproteobacteria bacterium]
MPKIDGFKRLMRVLRDAVRAETQGWSDSSVQSRLALEAEKLHVSRRDWLKHSVRVAAALPLAQWLPRALAATAGEPIVIVGGGIAGLVAALRLQQAGRAVEIYEGSARLGGRVFTKDKFNVDGMYCELGGELIDTGHKDVLALCKELGLPVENTMPFDVGVEQDLFHYGGRVYTQKEMIPAFRPLARHLIRDIKAVFPDGLVRMPTYDHPGANAEITKKFDGISLHEYLYSKTDVDRWALDAVEVLYVCEYGMDSSEQSALNLLVLIEPEQPADKFNLLGKSDECLRVRGGNSRLTEALEKRVRPYARGIHLRHKLVRIEDQNGKVVLTFEADGGRKTVKARQVVCAIPFATLRNVEGVGELALSPLKKKCINELGYGANTKFMLGFKERIWRKSGGPVSPASRATIVTDAAEQSFWETSKGQHGHSGIITNYLGGSRTREKQTLAERTASALAMLDRLYPGIKALHDGNAALFQWGSHTLNLGSYVSPKVGQYTTLWGSASVPELGGRLFFSGEHTSVEGAGFINGAVQSGNQVAAQVYGVLPGRAGHRS